MPAIDHIATVIALAAAALAWLGVVAVVLASCRAAAKGDRELAEHGAAAVEVRRPSEPVSAAHVLHRS